MRYFKQKNNSIMRALLLLLCYAASLFSALAQSPAFRSLDELPDKKPWTHLDFADDPEEFQFAIMSDRTGGHRPGVFEKGIQRINLLKPEFVMCVGDLIEGYTRDSLEVNEQWNEFATFLTPLEAPFFFLPGNHDISNDMMRNQWLARYGTAYYAFTYHDVLFIAMDSNDGDGVSLSEEQVAYVTQVIREHPEVRWTMLFMHHPIWHYQDLSGFQEIEKALEGRQYTVIAGHNHQYFYETRNNRNYYILATTGGGSKLRGPRFGEFDHVTWVTMTKDQGPVMVHLQLEGFWEHDVLTAELKALSQALIKSTQVKSELFYPSENLEGEVQALLLFQNEADLPLSIDARFFHHHQINPSESQFTMTIPAKSKKQIPVTLQTDAGNFEELPPLQLQWTMHYDVDSLKDMTLEGVYDIFWDSTTHLSFQTAQPKFLESTEVAIDYPFEEVQIKYTTDGSDPLAHGIPYTQPLVLEASAEVKAVAMLEENVSEPAAEHFEKVSLKKSQKIRKKQQGLQYTYFEGAWKKIPDFKQLTPKKTGIAQDLEVTDIAGERQNYFAIQYKGYIEVPADGLYTFFITSDDGSKLYIHEQLVVDNDGSHSTATQQGVIALKKGAHPVDLQYFEDFDGEVLEMWIEGPSLEKQPVSFERLYVE